MSLDSLISYISNTQIITELVKRIKINKELNIIGLVDMLNQLY